jgi:hypothetical protein
MLPAPFGVMSAVYVLPSTATKLPAEAFASEISAMAKPVTFSLNLKATLNAVVLFL